MRKKKKKIDFIWPKKYKILNLGVSATTYKEVVKLIISAAKMHIPALVTALPVHGVVTANCDPDLLHKLNRFNFVVPDGQPVRWSLNYLYNLNLKDRVYGPEMMVRLCEMAAKKKVSIYLYGSYPHVVKSLKDKLINKYEGLKIAGYESPPFRPLTKEEEKQTIERINDSKAGLVFIGLGCPQQDIFTYTHHKDIHGIMICVGAAFDFHSGNKKMAPVWMQRHGLEWLFRLVQEPRRLFKRYFYTNTVFIVKILFLIINQKMF